jgi:hypothetical protein
MSFFTVFLILNHVFAVLFDKVVEKRRGDCMNNSKMIKYRYQRKARVL